MSDVEREEHIKSCGQLMQAAMARYEASSCFSDHGEADYWRIEMQEAIKGRSAGQIHRMEVARGLA